jgi:hypothetical protein
MSRRSYADTDYLWAAGIDIFIGEPDALTAAWAPGSAHNVGVSL